MKSVTNTILKQCQKSWFHYSIIILLAFFQLFYKLDYLPIQKWDEGKNAVSAYEMLQNKNYLVRHYEGEPGSVEYFV
jgi:4-amino-4-deoxy-L-arabinose transferase-like glycosyltransferase